MNCWILVRSDPLEILGRGYGSVSPGPGEYILTFQDMAALEAHPISQRIVAVEAASRAIRDIDTYKSDQAYMNKAACAQAFLDAESVNEGVVSPTDPAVIDASLYGCLYDEYWNTYDLISDTPWDLARAIVANSDTSMTEATRRRNKLLQRVILNQPDPVIPANE